MFTELNAESTGTGLICVGATDQLYISRWGLQAYQQRYLDRGLAGGIWGWGLDSGILPCSVYLRHCYLSAQNLGSEALDSFLDDTFLVDRQTTVREYLAANPEVLTTLPPPSLEGRYSG